MNNKIRKTLLIMACVLLVFLSISNAIISSDIHHICSCKDKNCERCHEIYNSSNFLKTLIGIIIFLFSMLSNLLYILKKVNVKEYISNTLVNSNVQLNE